LHIYEARKEEPTSKSKPTKRYMRILIPNPNGLIVEGTKAYKDDTIIGEVINVDPDTGNATIDVDSMFDNWIRGVIQSGLPTGISSRKLAKPL
jgi:hypothetical protein